MLKKIIWLFVASLLINVLSGCNPYSKDEFKEVIQNGFDRALINNKLKGNYCYYVGSFKFPHTTMNSPEDAPAGEKASELIVRRKLAIFYEIGLLTRKPVEGQAEFYHYDLTDLGKEYQHLYIEYYNNGKPEYSNSFCYGVIKVDKVTNIEVENNNKMPYPHKHEVFVDYDYHVEEVPEWAVLNQDKLNHRFNHKVKLEGKTHKEQMRYQEREDGYLHPFLGYYNEIMPRTLEDEQHQQ